MKALFIFAVGLTVVLTEEQTAVQEFADGNMKFSAQVYKDLLKSQSGNFIVSPLSVDMVLALTLVGAEGETAQELTKALSLPNLERTEEAVKTFLPQLTSYNNQMTLAMANKIFANEKFPIKTSFQTIAENVFDAGVSNVDFSKSLEAASVINSWVANKTNNIIDNLISPSSLSANTSLVLVNALYFLGKWDYEFEEDKTKKAQFYTSKSATTMVDMMETTGYYGYTTGDGAEYLEMDYAGNEVTMTIILPSEIEGLSKIEESAETSFQVRNLPTELVKVKLPKWTVESSTDFRNILINLGVKKLFQEEKANLSGISKLPLYVSSVFQKGFIAVTETGTQAAVATGEDIPEGAMPAPEPSEPIEFVVDHPFVYLIRDKKTGIVLFAGRYTA